MISSYRSRSKASLLIYLIMGGILHRSGGWGKYIRELATYLIRYGFRVKILSRLGMLYDENALGFSPSQSNNVNDPISIYELIQNLPNPATVFVGIFRIIKDFKKERDFLKILHVHDLSSSLLIAFLINTFFRLPLVIQVHGFL